jgi:hypothetical protein
LSAVTLTTAQFFDTPLDRYEYKYRIPPGALPEIRRRIGQVCEPDPKGHGGAYRVATLYFDSPRRVLYRQGVDKAWKRIKLRVRHYEDGPYFLEVKRRHKRLVLKSRVAIEPGWWPSILTDPTVAHRCGLSAQERARVEFFLAWYLRVHAAPVVVIRYRREAYVSRVDRYARVTVDTSLEARPALGHEIPIADEAGWIPLDDAAVCGLPVSGAILELKSTTDVPLWMTDLARELGLQTRGFSKYARGVEAVENFPVRVRGFDRSPLRGRWRPW